jgi:hypothetical protein
MPNAQDLLNLIRTLYSYGSVAEAECMADDILLLIRVSSSSVTHVYNAKQEK